jgi:hypothetical protein
VKKRLKKTLIIVCSLLILVPIVVIICISPITKYLVEKYSVKYTGRQIKMNWAYVNPFTGYVYLKELKINEAGSDSVFLSAASANATFSLIKLFSKTCEITEITLDQPHCIIIQTKKDLNFSDIIERFSSKDTIVSKTPFHINILNWKINDGILRYRDNMIPINYSVIRLNIESPGLEWNMDTLAAKVSLLSGNGGGGIEGSITINLKNLTYKMDAVISKLELKFLEQYFKQISNYGNFRADLDADIKVNGSFKDAEDMNAKGLVMISNFHFGESTEKDFASFEKFTLRIAALNPKNKVYILDSVSLNHPYFKFEQYDYLNNVYMMFLTKGAIVKGVQQDPGKFNLIVEIGNYIKALSQNFFRSNYKVNRLAIYNGDFKYNDFSLDEKFSIDANPLFITADSIKKSNARVNISFKSGIKPFGNAIINLSINPKDSSDFDLNYYLRKLPIALFNPYLVSFTSFPLDRGTMELDGTWKVRNGIIQSNNHLLVIDPSVGRREKNKSHKWLPVRFIMFFVKETGNVVDYQIPISGNLKSPTFHFRDVVHHIIKNAFIKPVTTVYRTEVKNTEDEIENSLVLKWEMRQSTVLRRQARFLRKMADLLKADPSISFSVYPMPYTEKEKESILFFEAKKKYFRSIHLENTKPLNEDDSLDIDRMPNKDSLFIQYLNKHLTHSREYTIQGKCISLLGNSFVNTKLNTLNKQRENTFLSYFKSNGVAGQVKFKSSQSSIPYNGFSYYKIEYNGELPEYLVKAYSKMEELNGVKPRKKYNKERKKIKL